MKRWQVTSGTWQVYATLCALLITCHLSPATAAPTTYMGEGEIAASAKLYGIDFEKFWKTTEKNIGTSGAYTIKSTQKKCGKETFVTFRTDFENTLAHATREDFFTQFPPASITPLARRMFYPTGELYERILPTRSSIGNAAAYKSSYLIMFADGRNYRMDYYLTFINGYLLHINAYTRPKDLLRAAPCFERLFASFRVRDADVEPPVIEEIKPKSKYFN